MSTQPRYVPAPRPRVIDPADFLARFDKVRRGSRGNVYSARCPAHEDHDPSLTITIDPDGMILLHCHAGCSYLDVLSAVGLSPSALYPDGTLYPRERGGVRARAEDRAAKARAEQLRAAELRLALARESRRRGERLSPQDLAAERAAWVTVRGGAKQVKKESA